MMLVELIEGVGLVGMKPSKSAARAHATQAGKAVRPFDYYY